MSKSDSEFRPSKLGLEGLECLRVAVEKALDRKRRLGQYAVFWEDGKVILAGPDAPQIENGEGDVIVRKSL